ncbi:MAG: hypothetical protein KZQ99_04675 [Candidatus Thiodiazotropha sp. (ex Dulcina madagascariensis)]|nr:hypothetical protein [Candidatus Thiodiazotropha sp. (ex Dulcina madagascariensis)]
MCDWGIQATQVKLAKPKADGRTHAPVDPCIADIVQALNDAGLHTMASCCGHGKVNGRISLEDGRDLVLMNFDEAQAIYATDERLLDSEVREIINRPDCDETLREFGLNLLSARLKYRLAARSA